MASPMIRVSPEYGVNPTLGLCFFCGGDKDVVLMGHLTRGKAVTLFGQEMAHSLESKSENDVKAPRSVILDLDPCVDCKVFDPYSKIGVFFILHDGNHRPDMVCLREEAVKEFIADRAMLERVLNTRLCFVDAETWTLVGLDKACQLHDGGIPINTSATEA